VATVRCQGNDLIVHLLHYVHWRFGSSLDVIEDVLPLHDAKLSVRAAQAPTYVQLVPEGKSVDWKWADGYARLTVPRVDGYQIIRLAGAAA
jgi:hypothetical protein